MCGRGTVGRVIASSEGDKQATSLQTAEAQSHASKMLLLFLGCGGEGLLIFDQIDGGEGHTPKNKNMPNGCARTARRPLFLLRCTVRTYVPIFDAHSVDCLLSNPSGQKFVPNLCLCHCCASLAPLRGDPQRRPSRLPPPARPWPEEDPTDHTDRSRIRTQ